MADDAGAQLRALADDLRRAGRDVETSAQDSLKAQARPLEAAVHSEGIRRLPRRGGLAALVRSRARITATHIRGSGGRAGVTVTASGPMDLAALEAGHVVHPLYGLRRWWYRQRVPDQWFTGPVRAAVPRIAEDLGDDVHQQIRRALRG